MLLIRRSLFIVFLQVRASAVAAPVSVDVKKVDGSSAGSASVALRVADASKASGVVHRYLTLVRQNMRQVGPC